MKLVLRGTVQEKGDIILMVLIFRLEQNILEASRRKNGGDRPQ
jgi:hypothetical protein